MNMYKYIEIYIYVKIMSIYINRDIWMHTYKNRQNVVNSK